MRIVALLCGLAAGILILAMPHQAGIDLLPAFLRLWKNTDSQQLTAKLIWYAVPAGAIVGAVMALIWPGIAALLLLAAGLGWAGLELAVPAEFQYLAAVPAGLSVLGSIFAYIAGEQSVRRRREARRNRSEVIPERHPIRARVDGPVEAVAREEALRRDPLTMERPGNSTRPRIGIPLTLEDAAAEAHRSVPQAAAPMPRAMAATVSPASRGPDAVRPGDIAIQPERRLELAPEPQQRSGGAIAWLAVVNVVVLLALGSVVVYFVMQQGSPVAQSTVAAVTPPAAPSTTPATVANVPASATKPGYTEPFTYCADVGTIDRPDRRYEGPAFVAAISDSLGIPANSSADRVHWRCLNGAVLACTSFGWPACDMTPDAAEMLAFCKLHPVVPRLLAPNGTWSCDKGRPKLPTDASWPVDERGFLPQAWIPVAKPPTSG